jgi:hypothetical protein
MVGEPGQRNLFEKALLYTTFEMASDLFTCSALRVAISLFTKPSSEKSA